MENKENWDKCKLMYEITRLKAELKDPKWKVLKKKANEAYKATCKARDKKRAIEGKVCTLFTGEPDNGFWIGYTDGKLDTNLCSDVIRIFERYFDWKALTVAQKEGLVYHWKTAMTESREDYKLAEKEFRKCRAAEEKADDEFYAQNHVAHELDWCERRLNELRNPPKEISLDKKLQERHKEREEKRDKAMKDATANEEAIMKSIAGLK
jgi:hypothetical protein